VVVNIYGILRLVTGAKSLAVDLPAGSTLSDLLEEVFMHYPALREVLLDEQGRLRADQPLFLNGRNPRLLPGSLEARLRSDDTLSLFSPVSSGRINVEALRKPAPGRSEGGNEG